MRTTLIAAALALGFVSSARADILPPPGHVETCTAAIQQQADEVCAECETYHGEPTRCRDTLGATGHTQRCRTSGASVWTEVWCRPRTEADGPAPAAEPTTAPAEPAPSEPAQPQPAQPQQGQPQPQQGQATETQPAASSSCAVAPGAPASAALPLLALGLAFLVRRRAR